VISPGTEVALPSKWRVAFGRGLRCRGGERGFVRVVLRARAGSRQLRETLAMARRRWVRMSLATMGGVMRGLGLGVVAGGLFWVLVAFGLGRVAILTLALFLAALLVLFALWLVLSP